MTTYYFLNFSNVAAWGDYQFFPIWGLQNEPERKFCLEGMSKNV